MDEGIDGDSVQSVESGGEWSDDPFGDESGISLESGLGGLVGGFVPLSESDFISIGIDDGVGTVLTKFRNVSFVEFRHGKIGVSKTGNIARFIFIG
jgi:hypothetical protein